MRAVIALALGVGLAGAAQAHGTYLQGSAATTQQSAAMSGQTQPLAMNKARPTRQQMRQAQRTSRHHLRLATRTTQRHALHRTASLHRKQLNRQMGGQENGVGSSTPPNANGTTGTSMLPPATTPSTPNAGGNQTNQ